jgi:hypothetical protein
MDVNSQARRAELERDLLLTQADQGGEATFAEWLQATADDPEEFMHEQAVELHRLYYKSA